MIWALIQNDFRMLLRSPWSFVVWAGFLLIINYLFVVLLLTMGSDGFMPIVFDNMTNLSVVLVPILVMQMASDGWSSGLDEWITTQGVRPAQILAAKAVSVAVGWLVIVGSTSVNLMVLAAVVDPHWPSIASGWLGVILFGCVLVGWGVALSSLVRSSLMAAGGTFLLGLGMLAMSWLADTPLATWFPGINAVMVGHRLLEFQDGVIHLSSLLFLAVLTLCPLVVAWAVRQHYSVIQAALVAGIGMTVLGLTIFVPGKLELSQLRWTALSQPSIQLAKQVPSATITAWVYPNSYEFRYLKPLFDAYHQANPNIQYRLLDPTRHPELVARYSVSSPGTIIVESAQKQVRAYSSEIFQFDETQNAELFNGEPVINRALMALSDSEAAQIVFLTGHGEYPISGGQPNHLDHFVSALAENGFEVVTQNLAVFPNIPETTDLVVIPRLLRALNAAELNALKRYNQSGNAILIMLGPQSVAQSLTPLAPAQFTPNIVVDDARAHFYDLTMLVPTVVDHPLNSVMTEQNLDIVFPVASRLWPLDALPAEWQPLLISSPQAWVAPNVNQDVYRQYPGHSDGIQVLAAIFNTPEQGPIALIGNAEWITNRYIQQQFNLDYALRLTAYLAEQSLPMVGQARTRPVQYVMIRPGVDKAIFAVLVVILPLMVAGMGGWVWLRKRSG